jgi:hypothetical protein
VYGIGGIVANHVHHFDNHTIEFTSDKRCIYNLSGKIETYRYHWQKEDFYPAYAMLPLGFYFYKIANDTLIYSDAAASSEPITYYLLKAKK